ncbi:MAG TPA: phospholipid carrier-dependent glycosyltransferase [Streptosporangiaceae bacterium]|nr:phospholipid carrier-dependent glycosyltransferase [Streptosporangiaceae bacterium]
MMAHEAVPQAGQAGQADGPAEPPPPGPATARAMALAAKLVPAMPGDRFLGWLGPLLITALGTFLRFNRLSIPHAIVFDETYYVGDAYGILKHGVEINHVHNANGLLRTGSSTHILATGPEFVVHPPLGKETIAVGEWLFGLTPFGWRLMVAVLGSLAILMTARIARRMTRSNLLGCVAGLLLALDGLELVMSRTALLDISVMFWVLAAFGCLVIDRDRSRARLAAAVLRDAERADAAAEAGIRPLPPGPGPRLGLRWWRVAAGLCLGLAIASKWNGIWFLPVFAVMTLAWDVGARKTAGFTSPGGQTARDGLWLPLSFGLVPAAAYLASWSGWFASPYGYDRQWAVQHGVHNPIWAALDSLYQYQRQVLDFSVTLTQHHPYQSWPWSWLVMSRPVSMYYNGHSHACGVHNCAQEVLAIGTPAIWWASIPALIACLVWWLLRRDWRAGAVLAGVAAGWLPWFWYAWHDHRTMFFFYAVVFVPFLVIALTLCLGLIIGPARASVGRRAAGAGLAGAYLLAVVADFWYMYPVFAAKIIPYTSWLARMWYHRWI